MSKRWVTPSFESCASTAQELEKETNGSKQRRTKNSRPIVDQCKTQRGGRRPTNDAAKSDRVVDVLSKYEPETPDDLVIHVKKVEQVRAWIESRISSQRAADGKYLLLHGPSGSGKSTTFRVLAKSSNVQIIEWITPLDREQRDRNDDDDDEDGNDKANADDYDNRYFRGRSATDLFDSFLWRASRYSCLAGTVVCQKQRPQHELPPSPPVLKVIMVKDFPHSFAQNAQSFHDILRKYRAYDSYPMVFVCNDDALCRNLFPEQIRAECGVHDIAFNAVNCTAVTKALKRLLEMERRFNPALVTVSPNQLCLQTFHQQSAGDLRSALLKFYFSIVKPSPTPLLSTSSPKSSKAKTDYIASSATKTDPDDAVSNHHGLDIFKVVGRILYSKRETISGNSGSPALDDDYKFIYDPDQLVKSMTDQPSFFTGFLQENYVSRFQDIVSVASAADTFCVTDVVLKSRRKETAASDVMALSCLVRRLMVSNHRPKKSFAPFVKPKTCDSSETFAARLSRSVRNASPHFQFPASELAMHVVPFARAIPSLDAQLGSHLRQLSSNGNGAVFSLTTAR